MPSQFIVQQLQMSKYIFLSVHDMFAPCSGLNEYWIGLFYNLWFQFLYKSRVNPSNGHPVFLNIKCTAPRNIKYLIKFMYKPSFHQQKECKSFLEGNRESIFSLDKMKQRPKSVWTVLDLTCQSFKSEQ